MGMRAAMGRLLPLALLVSLVGADFNEEVSRSKRFAANSCQMTPTNSADMVVDKNQPVKLTCNFDSTVQSCIWSHYNPLNDGMGGTTEPDIMCTGSSGDTGRPCVSDSRISFQSTTTQCGISLSNTKPEDTGRWKLVGVGLTTTGSPQTAEKNLELWTYNQSYTRLTDNRDTEIKTLDTSYNYNIKKDEWESGKSDWENLEFKCTAYGGRPTPKFLWYVDSNNNDPLAGADGFTVTEGQIGSADRYGYVKHMESRITFRVDDKLLRRLEKYNINTNPSNGVISFELRCDVQQNLISAPERPTVRINVKKSYDDGNLTAGTIGIIVGVVVAVILAVIAIALLVFAKSSGRWCFADDEEAYRKPQEARPRTAGGPPAQSAQVYRGNGDNKTDVKPRGQPPGPIRRSSSTASSNDNAHPSNSSSNKSSTRKETKGEWIPDNTMTHTQPIIKKSTMDSGRSSNSPAPSSVSSHSNLGGGHPPPPRPYKSPDLQYANLDLGKNFMIDPRNRVLPSSQQHSSLPPAQQQPHHQQPTAYATIVSNSKIV